MKRKIKDPRMVIIRNYINLNGARVEAVARQIGVTNRTIYNWMEGKGTISPLASAPVDRFLSDIAELAKGDTE
jgi:transposase-like protein